MWRWKILAFMGLSFGVAGVLEGLLLERQRAGEVNAIDEGQTWHLCLSPAAVAGQGPVASPAAVAGNVPGLRG